MLYLLLSMKEIQISKLSNYLNVSEKTIFRSIKTINSNIKKFDCSIVIEQSNLSFKGNSAQIIDRFYSNDENDNFTTHERQIFIIDYLTKNSENQKSSISGLADILDFPISTIKKDIDYLNTKLDDFDSLILASKKDGLTINDFNQDHLILLIINLINNQIMVRQITTIVKDASLNKVFNSYIYKHLKKHWNIQNFNVIYKQITSEKIQKNLNISDYELIYISIFICVLLNHNENRQLLLKINSNQQFSMKNILETIYIDEGKKIQINNFLENFDDNKAFVSNIVDKLNKNIQELFLNKVSLSYETIANIKNHIVRIVLSRDIFYYNCEFNNSYIEGIQEYIIEFKELWNIIKKTLDEEIIEFNKKDILTYEIFIYVVVWFDQLTYNWPITIKTICIGGMGQSAMMSHHLKTLYKKANIEAKPLAMMNKEDYEKSDLIISSIDVESGKYDNVLHISFLSLMNSKEIIHKKLTNIIYKKLTKK